VPLKYSGTVKLQKTTSKQFLTL